MQNIFICDCRGNLNANNSELPCSSCGGINPNLFQPFAKKIVEKVLQEIEDAYGDSEELLFGHFIRLKKHILS